MPQVRLFSMGAGGIARDLPPVELPPEVFSGGQNVRFFDGTAQRIGGRKSVFETVPIPPYFAITAYTASDTQLWLIAGTQKAYAWSGSAWTNVTRQSGGSDVDYTGGAAAPWFGDVLERLVYLTNGVDVPQLWAPPDTGTRLQDLPNWPAGVTARVLKGFKNYLFAFDITEGGTRYPTLLRWGTPVGPGEYPASWDYTDATKDSGRVSLSQTAGAILTGESLGDTLYIYKDDSVWTAELTQSIESFIFGIRLREFGLIGPRAVTTVGEGVAHVAFGQDDVVLITADSVKSLINKRYRRALYNAIDGTNFKNSYCVQLYGRQEVWICYPEGGMTYPSRALVWNWKEDTIGEVELGQWPFIAVGPVDDTSANNWDSDSGTWDSDGVVWDAGRQKNDRLLACDSTNTKLLLLDEGDTFDGVGFTSYVERTGIAFDSRDRSGAWKSSPDTAKLLTEVWIGASGSPFNVYVGYQDVVRGSVTWVGPYVFTPGTDRKIDVTVNGKLLALKFEGKDNLPWTVEEVSLNVVGRGVY